MAAGAAAPDDLKRMQPRPVVRRDPTSVTGWWTPASPSGRAGSGAVSTGVEEGGVGRCGQTATL